VRRQDDRDGRYPARPGRTGTIAVPRVLSPVSSLSGVPRVLSSLSGPSSLSPVLSPVPLPLAGVLSRRPSCPVRPARIAPNTADQGNSVHLAELNRNRPNLENRPISCKVAAWSARV